jgi:hypothetical protein
VGEKEEKINAKERKKKKNEWEEISTPLTVTTLA